MKNYITTAIFYANSELHVGSAFEVIYADSIARYSRLKNQETFFLTGMDEHGQKIAESAAKRDMSPQAHCDEMSGNAKTLFDHLNISYNHFIRTTDGYHKAYVQEVFNKLLEQGDIYLGSYEGNYCVSCESFYPESQLDKGNCMVCGTKTNVVNEESYFLNLKKYEERLVQHINENESFILPHTRRNEVLSFISMGLENLSVTRTSFEWGIPTLNDPKHIVYVWIDALSNYVSALVENGNFEEFWNDAHITHIIGKDILRFHAIYWPIMLMALDMKLPSSIVTHGFIMMGDDKMSKSKGNVLYPRDFTEKYGIDPLRYYLLTELANGNDGSITKKMFLERFNSDLVNDLSNLVNRTASMCNKYFDEEIKYTSGMENEFEKELVIMLDDVKNQIDSAMVAYDTRKALQVLWSYVSRVNKFIDETTPWILAKEDKVKLGNVLYILVESIRNIAILASPFIPDTSSSILAQFNMSDELSIDQVKYNYDFEYKANEPKVIYQRINIEEELAEEIVEEVEEFLPNISFDEFCKIDMRTALILDCKKHPKADRLLVFSLQLGNTTRQIVSGIAEHYKPEELIGKTVVVVTNLEPRKIRGEISEGMILSAEFEDKLTVVESTSIHNSKVV